jgi:hypothetical protein
MIVRWLHLVTGILLVGNALFWVVMTIGVSRSADAAESASLSKAITSGRWPHVLVPKPLRVPLPALAWVFLVVLAMSGLLLLDRHGGSLGSILIGSDAGDRFARLMRAKLAVVGLLIVGLVLNLRPRRWLALINGALLLGVVAISALLNR